MSTYIAIWRLLSEECNEVKILTTNSVGMWAHQYTMQECDNKRKNIKKQSKCSW